MKNLGSSHFFINMLTVSVVTIFTTTGFCAGLTSGRIIPKGTVFIYKDGQKVGSFSKEAPLSNGSLMECEGRCGVKLSDFYMVAEDKSIFSVTTDHYSRELYVKRGTVYFAVSTMERDLVFKTDHGSFTTKQVLLNASMGSGMLKGYIKTSSESSELGVVEGGSMVVSTFDGDQMIRSGNRIVLAQADIGGNQTVQGAPNTGATDNRGISKKKLIIGGAVIVAATAALLLFQDDDDDPQPASPSTP